MKRVLENIGFVMLLIGAGIYDSSIIGSVMMVICGFALMTNEKWPTTDQG